MPPDQDIIIPDSIRGDVKFNTDAVGDFVILRSNGLPVYNFCVAIDDALMRITHVIRAVSIGFGVPVKVHPAMYNTLQSMMHSCNLHSSSVW